MKDLVFSLFLECKKNLEMTVDEKKCLEKFKSYVKERAMEIIEKEETEDNSSDFFEIESRLAFERDYVSNYYKALGRKFSQFPPNELEIIANCGEAVSREQYKVSGIIKQIHESGKKQIDCIDKRNTPQIQNVWNYYCNQQFSHTKKLFGEETMDYMNRSMQAATGSEFDLFGILSDYELTYSKYDHGITATFVFLQHFYYYQMLIDNSTNNKWLHMCFNIPNRETEEEQIEYINSKYKEDYQKIAVQVAYAILVHNLYPQNFNRIEGIRTVDTDNPFAYFSMMCDALQNWGRPYNVDLTSEEVPLFIDAEKYNISLDEFVKISFDEDRLWVMEKELNNFKNILREYLSAADEKIKISFK